MAKTSVSDVRPYVERAIKDEEFRDNLKNAFTAARDVYDELMGPRGVSGKAARVAADQDVRDNLRSAIEELRSAAARIQQGPTHKARNTLLVAAVAPGILLFNPHTGPRARNWLTDPLLG